MRMTHSRRKSRFLRRRPTNAYLSAVSTDSLAARYSLLLLAKYPLASPSSFLRLARRTVPLFTRGIARSPQERSFVRQHPRDLPCVHVRDRRRPAQAPLPFPRLVAEDMLLERFAPQKLAVLGPLEAF